jgi:hypothetical protein
MTASGRFEPVAIGLEGEKLDTCNLTVQPEKLKVE